MTFMGAISAVLGFRIIPTTVLLVLVYAAVFTTVLVTDELPNVPQNQGGLDLDQEYADLHEITARPHPFNSHSNELVHSYILSRVQDIASRHPYVHVFEDRFTNASWDSGRHGVYFEGTNILVKIDGTESEYRDRGGVLFSAHYDSVSTAPGTTDDGMGVVTLIQMVEYLGEKRPKRTAVFNINNGEEDGLHGAHVFMRHPWSNITDTFLNLEGASAGGRPIVFRSTSKAPLYSFLNTHVPHPHGNVMGSDGFSRGFIRSGTDYQVYAPTMEGLDFAFYKGRSKYHTKWDEIPGTIGGQKALWAMMEGVRGAGSAMVNDGNTHVGSVGQGEAAVYFDLFAAALIVLPLRILFTINIVLLAAGPVLLMALVYTKHVVLHRRLLQPEIAHHEEQAKPSFWRSSWNSFKSFRWLGDLWRLGRFWLAVAVGIGLQVLLVVGYININPFAVYSHPYLVVVSALSLAYLSTVLILSLPVASHSVLPEQQKLTVIFQTYILTWLLLLAATIVTGKLQIGSFYFISAWNAVVLLGATIGSLEGIVGAKGFDADSIREEEDARESGSVRSVARDADGTAQVVPEHEESQADPTENTPLIRQKRWASSKGQSNENSEEEEGGAIGWWILQLLIIVPVPAILVSHIAVLLMGALNQTLADGSSPITVYAAASLLSFLIILPLAPFSSKLHRYLTTLVLLIFVISTAYSWLAFPFSQDAPLKVFFQQRLELDLKINSSSTTSGKVIHATTALSGVPEYLNNEVIPQFPSALSQERHCTLEPLKQGLLTCTWESDLLPAPGKAHAKGMVNFSKHSSDWLSLNATRINSTSARISVQGINTRACRLYFDNKDITHYHVHGSSKSPTGKDVSQTELNEIRLWSRTWGKEFIVDVNWKAEGAQSGDVEGRVACEWVEYESATAGIEGSGGKIPALEEVLTFLPKWAVVSKTTDGLVEAWGKFSL